MPGHRRRPCARQAVRQKGQQPLTGPKLKSLTNVQPWLKPRVTRCSVVSLLGGGCKKYDFSRVTKRRDISVMYKDSSRVCYFANPRILRCVTCGIKLILRPHTSTYEVASWRSAMKGSRELLLACQLITGSSSSL